MQVEPIDLPMADGRHGGLHACLAAACYETRCCMEPPEPGFVHRSCHGCQSKLHQCLQRCESAMALLSWLAVTHAGHAVPLAHCHCPSQEHHSDWLAAVWIAHAAAAVAAGAGCQAEKAVGSWMAAVEEEQRLAPTRWRYWSQPCEMAGQVVPQHLQPSAALASATAENHALS